jgi:hypothetical protein
MSYWFEDPHTLVLARAPDRFTQSAEAGSTTRKIGNRFRRVRSSAHAFVAVRTECCSGFSPITGQAAQNLRRARCRATETSFAGSAAMPLQGSVEAFDQSSSVEGLGQQTNCSGFQHSRADGLVGEGCNENKWNTAPPGEQEGLHFDAAHGRHLDVGNHARCVVEVGRPQELLGRRKCMDDISKRA